MIEVSRVRYRWVWIGVAGLALAAIGVVALALLSPQGAEVPKDESVASTLSADPVAGNAPAKVDYARLDQRIGELMRQPGMVGLAVGTVERGEVRFVRGYGVTLAGSSDAVTPDTVFRWASVSKGVASALVARLAEEGRLSLDAPLSSMRTTLRLPGDASKVTVAHLLAHRVGLVRNAWDERLEAGEDPKALRGMLGTLPLYCPPGTCYQYQNIAFDAATEIVEQVTGHDYAAVARERLFVPLGMTHSSIGRAGLQREASWARPHRRGGAAVTVNDSYYRVPAAGGVNSSIRDLVRWMRAQMGDAPAVLSPALLETMHRPRIGTPPHGRRNSMDRALANASYGLGWRSFTYAGRTLVGHRGAVEGYGSLILFDPAEKSGIVMLWNSNQYKAARLQLEFFDMLYGLPPTDWLELDEPDEAAGTPTPEPTSAARK